MRKFLATALLCTAPIIIHAQNAQPENKFDNLSITSDESIIEVRLDNSIEDEDTQTLFEFENINQSEFNFKGESLKGKYYVVRMKEFLNGELIKTETLFDERGNDYFKIDSNETSFKLLTKVDQNDIKVWIRGNRFGSKQSYFPTTQGHGRYVAKDFFGSKQVLKENSNEPFKIMSLITPNRNKDGSGSYCRVAQSEIDPEEFGKVFDIPHYYLIEIEFTE
ncbi:hypothetical protein E0K83_02915 [Gramella sp. BOM4]|nr:hypothetical protein [Christiangramia bathymodioli]